MGKVLSKFNKAHLKEKILAPETVEALCKYDFPGNIRELANIIERLVVVTEKERIEARDLPNAILGYQNKEMPYPFLFEGIPLKDALEKYEYLIIQHAVRKYDSQREVAKALKVDQGTISRKIKKYSLYKNDVILHK